MHSFWIKVGVVIISVVCSSSFGHFNGYVQRGYHPYHHSHGHHYQTDFASHLVPQASHKSYEVQDDYETSYGYYSKHYSYGYNVHGYDPYGGPGPRFDKSETSMGGMTEGGYSVDLPDGRTQIVTYTVRGDEGFVAKVSYVPTESY